MSKFTLILDSSQLSTFAECPRMWDYSYTQRLSAAPRVSDAIMMGTYGHKLLENYYKAKCTCSNATLCLEAATSFLPTQDELPLKLELRELVLKRVREYTYIHIVNDIEPISTEYVEVGFSEPIYEDDEYLFVLEGRLDLLGKIQGLSAVMDHKFQLRKRDLYKKSIQFRNYGMISDLSLLMVNYLRLTQKVDDTTYARDLVQFSPGEHKWWRGELIKMYFEVAHAMQAAEKNGQTYQPNWGACSGKYGYPCDFAPLCEERNPQIKQSKKETMYHIKQEWRPW